MAYLNKEEKERILRKLYEFDRHMEFMEDVTRMANRRSEESIFYNYYAVRCPEYPNRFLFRKRMKSIAEIARSLFVRWSHRDGEIKK